MTFEEILPQIKRGHRATRKGWPEKYGETPWYQIVGHPLGHGDALMPEDLVADDWALEPEPEVIELGHGLKLVPDQYEVGAYRLHQNGNDFPAMLTHEWIDLIHAASLRIRGITPMSAVEAWEDWYGGTGNKLSHDGMFSKESLTSAFLAAFKLGQQSASPSVEYVEPDRSKAPCGTSQFFSGWMRGHKAGWEARDKA